jgi:hypothetical protein
VQIEAKTEKTQKLELYQLNLDRLSLGLTSREDTPMSEAKPETQTNHAMLVIWV